MLRTDNGKASYRKDVLAAGCSVRFAAGQNDDSFTVVLLILLLYIM